MSSEPRKRSLHGKQESKRVLSTHLECHSQLADQKGLEDVPVNAIAQSEGENINLVGASLLLSKVFERASTLSDSSEAPI